jgi:hypothetical protein
VLVLHSPAARGGRAGRSGGVDRGDRAPERAHERWASTLLEDEYSVREREALRCDEVPVDMVLEAVERWQQRAPEYNTWSELARRLRYRSQHTLRRALGAVAKDGRRRTKVDVELAARVVRVMGFTRASLTGCSDDGLSQPRAHAVGRCRGDGRLSRLVSVWVQVALSLGVRSSANLAGEKRWWEVRCDQVSNRGGRGE